MVECIWLDNLFNNLKENISNITKELMSNDRKQKLKIVADHLGIEEARLQKKLLYMTRR